MQRLFLFLISSFLVMHFINSEWMPVAHAQTVDKPKTQAEYEEILKEYNERKEAQRDLLLKVVQSRRVKDQHVRLNTGYPFLTQYDGEALAFILDYSRFLIKQSTKKEREKAFELLFHALTQIDLDRDPDLYSVNENMAIPNKSWRPQERISRTQFIEEVYKNWKWDKNLKDKLKEYEKSQEAEYVKLEKQFKETPVGREGCLHIELSRLMSEIRARQNAVRLVLAEIERIDGFELNALNYELDYIKNRSDYLSELSRLLREAQVYSNAAFRIPASPSKSAKADKDKNIEAQKRKEILEKAVAAYEKALELPFEPPDLPDLVEYYPSQQIETPFRMKLSSEAGCKADIFENLARLHRELGETRKLFDVSLKRLDILSSPGVGDLRYTAQLFEKYGGKDQFKAWVRQKLSQTKDEWLRVELYYLIGDRKELIRFLTDQLKHELDKKEEEERQFEKLRRWKGNYQLTEKEYDSLLAVVETKDPVARWLRLEKSSVTSKANLDAKIEALEALLQVEAYRLFGRGKAVISFTEFKSYEEIAYRLMRLYEKKNNRKKMAELTLRLAQSEKPFKVSIQENFDSNSELTSYDYAKAAIACYFFSKERVERVKTSNEELGDIDNTIYLTFRRSPLWHSLYAWGEFSNAPDGNNSKTVGWENLPSNRPDMKLETAFVSHQNVLSLCSDSKQIYAGFPWGIAIYNFKGEPMHRIAFADAALCMALDGEVLWIGGAYGLWRLDLEDLHLNYLPCDLDIPSAQRERDPFGDDRRDFNNGVLSLYVHGGRLWIGTRRNVQAYDQGSNRIRIFNAEELGINQHSEWTEFQPDSKNQGMWAKSDQGVRYYDFKKDKWIQAPHFFESKEKGTGIRLVEEKDEYEEITHLERLEEEEERIWEIKGDWVTSTLPDGRKVLGGSSMYAPRYKYPKEDASLDGPNSILQTDEKGGLIFLDPKGKRITSKAEESELKYSDILQGRYVFSLGASASQKEVAVGTDCEALFYDLKEPRTPTLITTLYRLTPGCVTSIVERKGVFYLACRSGREKGGFVVCNPKTGMLFYRFKEDGLLSNRIDALRLLPTGKIEITYAKDVLSPLSKDEPKEIIYPKTIFDPENGAFTHLGEKKVISEKEYQQTRDARVKEYERQVRVWENGPRTSEPPELFQEIQLELMPIVGGWKSGEMIVGDQKWIWGSRGIVIVSKETDSKAVQLEFSKIDLPTIISKGMP